jgi:hypothetical protein
MTPKIQIDINPAQKIFELTGNTFELLNKRRAKIYLFDFLIAQILGEKVIIPYEEETKDEIINRIIEFLGKFEFTYELSNTIKEILSNYFQENENFAKFSVQASQIRNNELSQNHLADFQAFSNTLNRKMINRKLYPLQLLASYHLAFSQNACNFSVPGSGKTSIVYGAYCYLKELEINDSKHIEKLIIIGPLSSFGPWESEYFECFGHKPNVKRLFGGISPSIKNDHFYGQNPAEISLLSYNSIPTIIDDLKIFLKKFHCMVVLDEAHKIKNTEGGLFANSVLSLAKYIKSRIVLTGTPAPNGYEDIYNLFKFIWPSKNVIGYTPFQLREMSDNSYDARIERFTKNIAPFFIRIRKSDLNIPEPIIEPPIIVEMGDKQREIYNYIEKKYLGYFLQKNTASGFHDFLLKARLVRLMQVSTNPSLLIKPLDEYYSELGYSNDTFIDDVEMIQNIIDYKNLEIPSKFISAGQLISNIISTGNKVVVWAVFIQNLFDFQKYLFSLGIESKLLYGATPIESETSVEGNESREKIINEFHKENSKFKVLIANPFAVAESISLHRACQHAIYLERTFNAANFIQSKDRIHRVGLTKPVHYYFLLSDNNTDRTIHQRLEEKEQKMVEIIEKEPIPLFTRVLSGEDTDDDLLRLVNNYVKRTTQTR